MYILPPTAGVLLVYSQVIRVNRERAADRALALAGPVSLMVVSAWDCLFRDTLFSIQKFELLPSTKIH